jgi:hypothetical protein
VSQQPITSPKRSKSIKRKNRKFMINSKEARSKFFYPVNAPRRRRSMYGKYRSSFELKATMDYINIDTSMSKDLFLDKLVDCYEVPNRELLKMNPVIIGTTKTVALDSDDNMVIYTPNPTTGKNSIITDAEQRLEKEILKLNSPALYEKKKIRLPEYRIPRPYYNRYHTVPLSKHHSLSRTKSLPTKFKDDRVEGLWHLYLRRVICGRIAWRLAHSSQPNIVKTQYQYEIHNQSEDQTQSGGYRDSTTASGSVYGLGMMRQPSAAPSSVDTGFFVNAELQESPKISATKSSSNLYLSPLNSRAYKSDEDINEPITDDELGTGSFISGSSGTQISSIRQAMFDSLDRLMVDVNSVITHL